MSLPLHPPLFPFHLRRGSQRKGPIWLSESGKWQGFHHEVQLLNRLSNYLFNCISLYHFVCAPRISLILLPFSCLSSFSPRRGRKRLETKWRRAEEERRRRPKSKSRKITPGRRRQRRRGLCFLLPLPPSLPPSLEQSPKIRQRKRKEEIRQSPPPSSSSPRRCGINSIEARCKIQQSSKKIVRQKERKETSNQQQLNDLYICHIGGTYLYFPPPPPPFSFLKSMEYGTQAKVIVPLLFPPPLVPREGGREEKGEERGKLNFPRG